MSKENVVIVRFTTRVSDSLLAQKQEEDDRMERETGLVDMRKDDENIGFLLQYQQGNMSNKK